MVIAAIQARDAQALTAALASGADPDERDAEGVPALLLAADSGQLALVEPLVRAGASLATVDDLGYTPLMAAVLARSLPLVQWMLARGADPGARATTDLEGGPTALTLALDEDPSAAIADALLAAGADPSAPRRDGWTPLMLVARLGDAAIAARLLAAGAEVAAAKGEDHTTAADIALHARHDAITALLRAAGAEDPAAAIAARVVAHRAAIDRWLSAHAAPLATRTGASEAAIAALERTIGERLPADLRAHLAHDGGTRGATFYEYEGLAVEQIAERWGGLEELRRAGAFDGAEPREIATAEPRVRYTWWHPGWIPFAQDGGGNLYAIDLAPGEHGARGQVIGWEVRGGPTRPIAPSFEVFLRVYAEHLTAGERGGG